MSDTIRRSRRHLLKLLGLGSAGTLGIEQTAASTQTPEREEETSVEEDIDEYVLTQQPILLPASITGVRQYVEADNSIVHTFPWKTVAGESKESLYELKEASEYSFRIDGKYVHESEGSWKCIWINPENMTYANEEYSEPYWRLAWRYITPSKPPGWYPFTTTIEFKKPYTSKSGPNETKTWEGVYRHRGGYKVIPEVIE